MARGYSVDAAVSKFTEYLGDDELRFAVGLALFSIPFTVFLTWQRDGSAIAGIPLLFIGLAVGFFYTRRSTDVRRAAIAAGLVASIGVLAGQSWYLASISAGSSTRQILILGLAVPVVFAVGIVLSVLIVSVSALLVERLRLS